MTPSPGTRSTPPWAAFTSVIPSRLAPSLLNDIPVLVVGLALFYGLMMSLTTYWAGPVNDQPVIHLEPSALPEYALFSVARLAVAYAFSLAIALVYGYLAAHNSRAERVLIPLLDTLQSIPVLSFLPPEVETFGHHADDGCRSLVNKNGCADNIPAPSKLALP
jgi:ABC-type proline/glycine betaine transport system permease subunit